ncbi:MAG: branched-chain amino acid ABC transporter permease [Actinobacteria bacterium]|nr:branched-chain amino acid ABC transporter permease [Actinomycetota bacterium]
MTRPSRTWQLVGPALLVVIVALVGSVTSATLQLQFRSVLVTTAIVLSIYVFVGNSGVISFGHISFAAVGAFAAGLATVPVAVKPSTFSNMAPFLAHLQLNNVESLILAALVGGIYAFWVGIPLMRLNGLSAGIGTFAVLIITHNVLRNWEYIGPGAKTLALVPATTGFVQATVGVLLVMGIAFVYQRSRWGRMLRATREDLAAAEGSGIEVHRQRLLAFTLSGALAGFSGGLLVHLLGSITTEQVFLDLTFVTLAMLVVGGIGSLWGAVIGAVFVAGLSALLIEMENGVTLVGHTINLPTGTRLVTLGLVMLLVLLFRPDGITGGHELKWPLLRSRAR